MLSLVFGVVNFIDESGVTGSRCPCAPEGIFSNYGELRLAASTQIEQDTGG